MNFETRLTFSMCLLALVPCIAPVQSASSVETNPGASVERIKRRSFYHPFILSTRSNSVSLYDASNTYRAAPYTVPRPYYIPVYGAPGRPVIFYPPQPIYANPGRPQDNPMMPSIGGATYLPPKVSPHLPNKTKSRIGEDYDQDENDDAPVWVASSGEGMVQMPLSGDQGKESGPPPTRAPMGRATSPPLVHNAQSSGGQSSSAGAQNSQRPVRPVVPERSTQRPPSTRRTTTLRTTTPVPPSGPSNCVWAIISCCSAANPSIIPQNCFDQRGCPGPFWDSSPCESDYARAAIAAAVNYYNTNPRSSFGK